MSMEIIRPVVYVHDVSLRYSKDLVRCSSARVGCMKSAI